MTDGAARSPDLQERTDAFTLVELLTVLAIVGILVAILIPTLGSAQTSALKAKTRVQFSQWTTAVEAFRQEYGHYPMFHPSHKVNGGALPAADQLHPFYDTLVGRRRDGAALPRVADSSETALPEGQNVRRLSFIRFSSADLFPADFPDGTRRHLLRDAFDNGDIAVLVDVNLDGVIDRADYPELPLVSPPDDVSVQLSPEPGEFAANGGGVRAGAIFYSAPPKARDQAALITSWR